MFKVGDRVNWPTSYTIKYCKIVEVFSNSYLVNAKYENGVERFGITLYHGDDLFLVKQQRKSCI